MPVAQNYFVRFRATATPKQTDTFRPTPANDRRIAETAVRLKAQPVSRIDAERRRDTAHDRERDERFE
jgi:hypothetical protein